MLEVKDGWEISLLVFEDQKGALKFKVTKRLPEYSIAETKIFNSLEEAKKQVEEWLS